MFKPFVSFSIIVFLFTSCGVKKNTEEINFLVAGHVYGAPEVINKPFHPPFQNYLLQTKEDFDFAIFTGDIVQESDLKSWDSVDNFLKLLPFPVYFAPGNHDLKNRELYESRYGSGTYQFERNNNLFLFWDLLNVGWNIPEKFLIELEKKTSKKHYDNIFIFSHHLFWYDTLYTPEIIPNSLYKRDNSTFYSQSLPQLQKLKTPIYCFGGDVGANANGSEITLHRIEDIRMIASGMGGGKMDNVITVSLKNKVPSLQINYLTNHKQLITDSLFVKINMPK